MNLDIRVIIDAIDADDEECDMSAMEDRFRAWKTLLLRNIHEKMTPAERAEIAAEWVLVLYGGKLLDERARNYMSWSDGVAVQKAQSIAGACVGIYRARTAAEKERLLQCNSSIA